MQTIQNMTTKQEQALNRILEIQKELQEKKEEMRKRNSYEFINANLSRFERQRANKFRTSHAFKSKSSQCNCHTGGRI